MKDLFGELLVKIIPFIIPAILVASFMMNHKPASSGQSGNNGQQKSAQVAKGSKAEAKAGSSAPAQAKESVATEAIDPGEVAGKIAEFASKAAGGDKSEDPYRDTE